MKISGFTFVRNAVVFCYPMLESLKSLYPLCDEIIIAAGRSDDNTLEVLRSFCDHKIKIIETEWDLNLKKGGLIYSQQTNLALDKCTGDWCIYLQADEVLHEEDHELILNDIRIADNMVNTDAVLFRYHHFYGSYEYTGIGRQWYRREIRAFRNSRNIISWGDAQGFRKKSGDNFKKLTAIQSDARIFHYGWVRPPKAQHKKIKITGNYYNENTNNNLETLKDVDFDYNSAFELDKYEKSHPVYMEDKIKKDHEWAHYFNPKKLKAKPFLVKLTDWIEKQCGWRIGEFKDFILIKRMK